MIQSPVGTGKSFLFFDGLIYGLYKHCDRNIVNAKCKDADIYIIFSVDNELYMIHRNITATATKTANSSKVSESTKSKLYIYNKAEKAEIAKKTENDRLCEEQNDEAIHKIPERFKSENIHNIYKNLPNDLISKVK